MSNEDFDVNYDFGNRILNFVTVFSVISQHVKCKTCNSDIAFHERSPPGLGFNRPGRRLKKSTSVHKEVSMVLELQINGGILHPVCCAPRSSNGKRHFTEMAPVLLFLNIFY
ncbi:uncharacterized protein LOC117174838 [Belonocnema kinseyi]|uniref:uncharacterized protein LOC117174838 n=1 Tax=Belonocnema kinseyi TaxID=2817044 RepID=UPI00143D263C|nr:uncharacterized protein LOC117174838 [Belonocnema kinseyi]